MVRKKKVEIPKPTTTLSTYKYQVQDRVLLVANGNQKYDGTGALVIKRTGLKWIGSIMRGATYPYLVITETGKPVGYFQESALQKI